MPLRSATGDFVMHDPAACPHGRSFSRFHVQGRLDDRFAVSGVDVSPDEIEFVVRGVDGLSGVCRVTVLTADRLTEFNSEVENNPARRVKTRLGDRPRHLLMLAADSRSRATRRAKRLVDRR